MVDIRSSNVDKSAFIFSGDHMWICKWSNYNPTIYTRVVFLLSVEFRHGTSLPELESGTYHVMMKFGKYYDFSAGQMHGMNAPRTNQFTTKKLSENYSCVVICWILCIANYVNVVRVLDCWILVFVIASAW